MQRHRFSLWGCVTIGYLLNAVAFMGLHWLVCPDGYVTDSNRVFATFTEAAWQILMLPFGTLLLGCFSPSCESAAAVLAVVSAFVVNAVIMGGLFAMSAQLIRFCVAKAMKRRTH
jgi:hypothetical protein